MTEGILAKPEFADDDCDECAWDPGETPYTIQITLAGIHKPDLHPEAMDFNGIYFLDSFAQCWWRDPTWFTFDMFFDGAHNAKVIFLAANPWPAAGVKQIFEDIKVGCVNDFVNDIAGPEDLEYYGGTATILGTSPYASTGLAYHICENLGIRDPFQTTYFIEYYKPNLQIVRLNNRLDKTNVLVKFEST